MLLDKIQNLSTKKKIIITLFTNSLVIFLIINFVIIPRIRFIKESSKEIIDRKVFLEEQYIKAKKFRENNEEMEVVDEDIQKLDKVFVSHDNDLQFIESLEKTALDNNIKQKILLGSVQNSKDNEFEKIILEISAEGNFKNMMNYLISLETLDYYINISSLDILKATSHQIGDESSDIGSNSLSNVICKITADTYWK
jgi:Tfp pilus assembly protein PilO